LQQQYNAGTKFGLKTPHYIVVSPAQHEHLEVHEKISNKQIKRGKTITQKIDGFIEDATSIRYLIIIICDENFKAHIDRCIDSRTK
jgi:hypothetical protein